MCRCTLWHCGQVKVRRSWPNALGSIAVNFIGESHAAHCGPWFCVSSMPLSCSGRGQCSLVRVRKPGKRHRRDATQRARDGIAIMLRSLLEQLVNTAQIRKIDSVHHARFTRGRINLQEDLCVISISPAAQARRHSGEA
jgi:hypothetical protein